MSSREVAKVRKKAHSVATGVTLYGQSSVIVDSGWAAYVSYDPQAHVLEVETLEGEYVVYRAVSENEYSEVLTGSVYSICRAIGRDRGYEIWSKVNDVPVQLSAHAN